MSDLAALQTFVNEVLSERPREVREGTELFRAAAAPVRPAGGPGGIPFTPFIPEHTRVAVRLATRLGQLAGRGEAVTNRGQPTLLLSEAVQDAAATYLAPHDPELLRYAVKLFATHDPVGRRLEIPRLEERAPLRALAATASNVRAPHAFPPEDQLDWFRGDVDANEHHEHWHVVYPNSGLPVGDDVFETKDRQGELFLYMHQQMLARYDAERMAAGLPPVRAFEDYRQPIQEGFEPGDLQVNGQNYSPRPAGTTLVDLVAPFSYRVLDHERRRERAVDAVDRGYVEHGAGNLPLSSDVLGATLEETVSSPDGVRSRTGFYGNFHGMGHVLSALCTDPTGQQGLPPGVMYDTAAAIRDPFFWQWHRHVDDYYFRWQERLAVHDFSDAPPVVIRDPTTRPGDGVSDIILATAAQVRQSGASPSAYGEAEFGGEHWSGDFTSGERSTGTLVTRMRTRSFEVAPGEQTEIQYLYPDDFYYFIRVENGNDFAARVTLRVFLAPEATVENRRTWIEMDKFDHTLPARARVVVVRSSQDSSVIRKPVVEPGQPSPPVDPSDESYCKCGWPYGLLLPRGTRVGMDFRLFVMATDWNLDRVRQDSCCGSFSYCGAQDFYPDRRPMGYPFDRPYPAEPDPPAGHPFYTMVAGRANMSTRPVRIVWADPEG